jgi:hypothetical protein
VAQGTPESALRRGHLLAAGLLLVLAALGLVAASGRAQESSFPASRVAAVGASAKPRPGRYFRTLPSGAHLPRRDRLCASRVARRNWEPRPSNYPANLTVPSERVRWPQTPDQLYWRKWIVKRAHVSGHYTGTTDEIIGWAACKWGIDENTIRAAAVYESDWRQATVGDDGGSFGLMQVKDHYSDGSLDLGGYPWTQLSTALNVDVYAAWIRSCLAGDFYDGGYWLYGRQTIKQVIAAKGFRYAFWGCIGAWYSGDWYTSGAVHYIIQVERNLAGKSWRNLG